MIRAILLINERNGTREVTYPFLPLPRVGESVEYEGRRYIVDRVSHLLYATHHSHYQAINLWLEAEKQP